jgi:hypothetical protein
MNDSIMIVDANIVVLQHNTVTTVTFCNDVI